MKKQLLILTISILTSFVFMTSADAQNHELSFTVGTTNFLGELGGANDVGSNGIKDLELSLFRPSLGVTYRAYVHDRISIKTGVQIGQIRGNDALIKGDPGDPQWFRKYRNLHFKSPVIDFTVMGEFNFMKYKIGCMKYRFTPHVGVGAGLFYFNPKAEYNGEWVALQPLGTEGQGLESTGRAKYARIQPSVPVSIGFKYNLNRDMAVGFDISHRFTFTDYVDDVSADYVALEDFQAAYSDDHAQMVYDLSRRSTELDADEEFGHITAPGQQRGDPDNNDQFFFINFSFSMKIDKGFRGCPY